MLTALVGLLGVVVGLLVGRGYTFWSTRRSELAEALFVSSVLARELRELSASADQDETEMKLVQRRVEAAWRDHSRWLLLHMGPTSYERLADWVPTRRRRAEPPFGQEGLIETLEALARVFWEEHEAFILVPLIHYVTGNTVSKRIEQILDRETKDVPPPRRGLLERWIKPWHSPSALDKDDSDMVARAA